MILDKCPHCQTSHVQVQKIFSDVFINPQLRTYWHIVRCQNNKCSKLILLIINNRDILRIYPSGTYTLNNNIPVSNEIKDEFQEAGQCLASNCYKASMVMSRRVLQRILKDQGCTDRTLVKAIEFAVKQDILRKSFHPIAEEIRQYGNLGAHPDDNQLSNATKENAQQILDFVRLIIQDFYEVPAAAELLKKQREETNTE